MAASVLIIGCGKKDSASSRSTGTSATMHKTNQNQIVITFGSSNSLSTLVVAGTPCPPAELDARLKELVGQNMDAEAVIRGGNLDDKDVKSVADACKKAGVHVIHYAIIRF